MRKKNRNYRILKKVNSAINRHGISGELVTRLNDKKTVLQKMQERLQMNQPKQI